MADPFAPKSIIINALASGEISPSLYGRTDLAKFHQGAFVMRNFLIDYKGGAKTRPGDQFMGFSNNSTSITRIYPFKFSATIGQTYILVFTNNLLEFIKNPGGVSYPNSSNSGFILNAGVHYTVATPYVAADLNSLKFSQIADVLTITHPNYPRYNLSRVTDTNWTLTQISDTTIISPPTISSVTITGLPSGSTDPQTTRYIYAVSAVDPNGNESLPSPPFISDHGIDIGVTQGSVSVFWSPVANAQYYKVYKGLPAPGNFLPQIGQSIGFCGYAYGTNFVDSNIVPDFTKTPLLPQYPFAGGQVTGYNITAQGTGYPVGTTGISLSGGGTPTRPATIYAINASNVAGGTSGIAGLWIADPGEGYSSAPTITAIGGGTGFAATLSVSSTTGVNPSVSGLFQQREIYANTANNPNGIYGSRIGTTNDFRTTNPIVDSDALSFNIASAQVNQILWMRSMPGGLVIGTDAGIVQLTGGSASATNPLAVTPSSAVIVPQSYFGSADVEPIVINYDIIYVQSEGGTVRDLQYSFFVNIYTGTDITTLSSHLFYPNIIKRMGYQDSPNKTIWCIRSDGALLSLAFLKEQEVMGWAHHDTFNGLYEDVAVVQENTTDAVYFVINRSGTRYITRQCDQLFNQIDDAWCLDSALSTTATYPAANLVISGNPPITGAVTITADTNVFGVGDVNKVLRYLGGRATITAYISPTQVSAIVDTGYPFYNTTPGLGLWRLDPKVSTVGGLAHLNGYSVVALADGLVQGPFVVAGGSVTLTTPASAVVVGLAFTGQLQPLYADVGGEVTIAGRLKKLTAVTLRVRDTARIKFGTDFSNLREFVPSTVLNTDVLPNVPVSGLILGDIRQVLNQTFNRIGAVAIQQDNPLPAHVLAVIPEIAQGDTA